jgi:hypothetical protein
LPYHLAKSPVAPGFQADQELRAEHIHPQARGIALRPWNEARDLSESVLGLASDQAHHVTGMVLLIDAGQLAK